VFNSVVVNRALLVTAIGCHLLVGGAVVAHGQDIPPTLVVTESVKRMEFADQVRLVGRTQAWTESRTIRSSSLRR